MFNDAATVPTKILIDDALTQLGKFKNPWTPKLTYTFYPFF